MRTPFVRGLPWLLLALASAAAAADRAVGSGRVDDAGVQLRWHYEPLDDADGLGRLSLELRERASGSPLRYAPGQLAAWLQRQRPALSEGELSCRDRVKSLVSTGIGRRADVDLNTYRVLTLNADHTLAVINPFVALNNAKLESIVPLPGAPLGWVQLPARGQVWVLLAGAPLRVAAVDLQRRRVTRTLALGGDAEPQATLAADAGAQRLWVALPAAGRIATLDLAERQGGWRLSEAPGVRAVHRVEMGAASAIFSAHDDGRLVRWTAGGDGPPRREREWRLPQPARGLAYSRLARRLVAHDGQAVLSIDPLGPEVRRLALGHPVGDLVLVDEGRYAIAAGGDRMSMLDLASGTVHARSSAVADVRHLVLTSRFAYAIGAAQTAATLWALADLRAGRVQPAQVLLGSAREPAGDAPPLARAVVAPGGAGLLVAHGGDQLVYQYSEGMMAPIGSYSNYRRRPLALDLLDLAPREVAPGRYEVTVRYEVGGPHQLVVSGANPRFAVCDRLALAPTADRAPREAPAPPRARLLADAAGPTGQRRILLALDEPADTGAATRPLVDVPDLTLLLFDKRSGWQQRARLRPQAPGRYEALVAVPAGARYQLFVGSAARDLPFARGRVPLPGSAEARP